MKRLLIDVCLFNYADNKRDEAFAGICTLVRRCVADGHAVFILLEGREEGLVSARAALTRLLPANRIRAVQRPLGAGDWWREAGRRIHSAMHAELRPDITVAVDGSGASLFKDAGSHVYIWKTGCALTAVSAPSGMNGVEDVGALVAAIESAPQTSLLSAPTLPSGRPKLACFTPLPPVQSGIADYSTELLPELSRHYEIDVIVNQEEVGESWVTRNCNIRQVEWFLDHAAQYERVLYHIGNAEFHLHMFDCLEKVPGVVVLHDFYLSGAYSYREFEQEVPHAWSRELYRAHGYQALRERCRTRRLESVAVKYPTNLLPLQRATGIIVHSEYSRRLAAEWYGEELSTDWVCIPHLRVAELRSARDEARTRLGLRDDDFVICSFGKLGAAKQNQRLLDAWLFSDLADDPHCRLVFVGANSDDDYGRHFLRSIRQRGLEDRVVITGWASTDVFRDYLAAADLAVQLRTLSRGETSGTVLDCMNHGVATIVNASGSMADLPRDAVWMLPEEFDDGQLIDAMETLRNDAQQRMRLGARGRQAILENHDPARCADEYAHAIECFHERSRTGRNGIVEALTGIESLPAQGDDLAQLAATVAQSLPPPQPAATLFIDVTVTSRTDLKTGIERVTRALLNEFIENPPHGYRAEPVYLSEQGGAWHYRHARQYALGLLGCPRGILFDEPIEPQPGDLLFSADLAANAVTRADAAGVFRRLRAAGVGISFMVHDLLPVTLPEVFPLGAGDEFEGWLRTVARISDSLVGVSRAVAEELRDWLLENEVERNTALRICWSHHGADIHASAPSRGLPASARHTLDALAKRRAFLMVGTIEPRKGYAQTLAAFEQLWQQNVDVSLVIVGKEGWQDLNDDRRRDIPMLVQKLRSHPERNRRLFWLEGISDEFLEKLYAVSDCLLAASFGEGFGLPLIEASRHGVPVLARDLPVFREVTGRHATYFSGIDAASLANAVKQWLSAHSSQDGDHVPPPALDWTQSGRNLASLLVGGPAAAPRHAGEICLLQHDERKHIYVDVSVVSRDDFRTGIQRAVRALFSELSTKAPQGYAIYPVRLNESNDCRAYEIDEHFFGEYFSDRSCEPVPRGEIAPRPGDILLGLDLAGSLVVAAERNGVFEALKTAGARVCFVVYDLLPVLAPQYFPPGDVRGHEEWLRCVLKADSVICISRAVAEEFAAWGREQGASLPAIHWFHLGADVERSRPNTGLPENAGKILSQLAARPMFLMVGTIEPRKGYGQTLQAFERLWMDGLDVNLVIVGKKGWNVDSLADKLRTHQEAGERLFWLEGASDEFLEIVYARSTCLLSASEGEGFGLPLIEAARHGLPLVLRDIAVFREVAGQHAYYFRSESADELASALREWLALYKEGNAPSSRALPWLTWRESAEQLLEAVLMKQRELNENARDE